MHLIYAAWISTEHTQQNLTTPRLPSIFTQPFPAMSSKWDNQLLPSKPAKPAGRMVFMRVCDIDYRRTEDPDPQRAIESRKGHRHAGSTDRPAHQPDHRTDRAPQDTQE